MVRQYTDPEAVLSATENTKSKLDTGVLALQLHQTERCTNECSLSKHRHTTTLTLSQNQNLCF